MSTVNFSIESAQAYLQHLRLNQHVQNYRLTQLEKKVTAYNLKTKVLDNAGYDVDEMDTEAYGTLAEGFWNDADLTNF